MKAYNNNQKKSFMSLSKIAYGYDLDPSWASDKWLSEPSTLEYIQLWENLHNLDFKNDAFIKLCSCALGKGASPSISEMQKEANIKSMFIDKEYRAEVFMHKDLAIDFTSWVSPIFRTFCLITLQDPKLCSDIKFRSEEDFVISAQSLAAYTKKAAIDKFKKEFTSVKNLEDYSYYVNENNH